VIEDGWLLTGDLGRVGADGFVYLSGRAKDLIIRGGHNIDPRLIEEAMLSHIDVAAVAAVPRPDAHSGEVPAVYVVLRAGATANVDALRRWATAHCPEPASVPKFFHIVEAIPVTAVGKVHKVPLVHDSIRRVVRHELEEARLSGQVVVADVDGRAHATVRLPANVSEEHLASIRNRLSRYEIDYEIDGSVGNHREKLTEQTRHQNCAI
jgi:fatty-acyl-CoA synthase